MLNAQQNERLTRVGRGTPMGELMRRYWIPIRPTVQLLADPVLSVRVLGEDLVLFRTLKGDMGLIDERCPHRSANMKYGIPNDDGLRCMYHGWKMDATGKCLDMPLESQESSFKDKVRVTAYPVQEMGGLVWAYLGPLPAPLLPPWPIFTWPNSIRQIGYTVLPCNWLQCHENTGDPGHSVYMHGYTFKYQLEKAGLIAERAEDQTTHRAFTSIGSEAGIAGFYARPSSYGIEKGMSYSKALGGRTDGDRRHSTVIFPFFTGGSVANGVFNQCQVRVPIDDTHTYHLMYEMYAAPPGVEAPRQDNVPYYEYPYFDRQGEPILDYVLAQDMVGWWSQGSIADRTQERLGRSDIPIILLRRQFEENIRVVEEGGDPLNCFRDAAKMEEIVGDTIFWTDGVPRASRGGVVSYREQYHKGYWKDDSGRYGPASQLILDLEERVENARAAR